MARCASDTCFCLPELVENQQGDGSCTLKQHIQIIFLLVGVMMRQVPQLEKLELSELTAVSPLDG
jgi:hypothetical protein